VKDPEPFLLEMDFEAACAVREDAAAKFTPQTRVQINHDLFYVSRPDYVRKIQKDPLKYASRLTDPVTRTVFRPTKKSPRSEYAGKKYFFASDSTRAVFAANPMMYEFPPESMRRAGADSSAVAGKGAAGADSATAAVKPAARPDSAAVATPK
jgi:YHS domain-containing protein